MATQITEEERRWTLIGLCLTKVLTPALRKVLAIEIPNWYNDLCQHPTEIDRQVYPRHQKSLAPSISSLNYKNINNNRAASGPSAYDYSVKDPLSLAKLFCMPFMCSKLTGFDQTMDTSAALSLISEAAPFINMGAAAHVKDVRDIRNEWGHQDYPDEERFDESFEIMESLLKSINLSSKDEEKFCNDLRSWKDYGQPLNMEVVYLLRKEAKLRKRLNDNEARLNRLISVQGKDTLRVYFDSIYSPATLTTTLKEHHETLETLHERGEITSAQMKVLFPPVRPTTSSDYDVSLLFILLRNICGLNPPASTGSWDENPPPDDTSPEADLARIGYYRNEVLRNDTEVSDDDFNTYWNEISNALIQIHRRLNKPLPTREIKELRTSPVGEDSYIVFKRLEEIVEMMGEIQGRVEKKIEEEITKKITKLKSEQKYKNDFGKLLFWFLALALVILTVYTLSTLLENKPISLQDISNTEFVGREWIFRELENRTCSKKSRGVLLVAEPGWGKSTIMKQLINSPSSSDVIHKNIIGYHFCNFNDDRTRDGGRFVKNISRFITEKVSKFREVLVKDDDCENLPVACFKEAIINPLKKLDDTGRRNSYILIDALDECLEKEDGHRSIIKEILYETISDFPSWVKLIISSRNQSQSIGEISTIDGFSTLEILVNDKHNKKDLRLYAEQKLQNFSAQTGQASTDTELIDLALKISQDNFLFLREIIKYWKAYPGNIDKQYTPKSLGDIYKTLFTKRFKKDDLKRFQPLLEVVLASKVPLTLTKIEDILYLYDNRYRVHEVAIELSQFFKSGQARLEFYHQFFAEWLTNQTDGKKGIFIQKSNGHQYIVNFLFRSFKKRQTNLTLEELSELCEHILNTNEKKFVENIKELNTLKVFEVRDRWNRFIFHDLAIRKDSTKMINALIGQFNNSVDILDNIGFTPAKYAAEAGAYENLKILIKNGANFDHTRPFRLHGNICNFLHFEPRSESYFRFSSIAAYKGHIKIAELLIKSGADINKTDHCGLKPLHFAVMMRHFEIVRLYLKHGSQADVISLHQAAARNHTEIARLLLKTGIRDACLLWSTEDCLANITQLHLCSSETALYAAVANNNIEMVKLILDAGNASVNCRHGNGKTALMEAIARKNVEMVQRLIREGANINAECKRFENWSDIHQDRIPHIPYINFYCDGYRVIDFLFAHGLWKVVTPMISEEQPHAIFSTDKPRWSPATVASIYDDVDFINTTYGNKISTIPHIETVLRYVTVCHSVKTFKLLWNSGKLRTKFRSVFEDGRTLLHFSTSKVYKLDKTKVSGPLDIHCPILEEGPAHTVDEKRLEMVNLLTKILASKINKKDNHGRTALHYAAVHGLPKIVEIFLKKRADCSIEDERGDTALEFALREKPEDDDEPLSCRMTSDEMFEICESSLLDKTISYLIQNASIKICNSKTKKLLDGLIKHELPLSLYELLRSELDVVCAYERFVRAVESNFFPSGKNKKILKVFMIFQINLDVKCGIPFRQSLLHLAAYVRADEIEAISLFQRFIDNNPKGVNILNECYDKEGYLPIHRAIQSKNYVLFSWFMDNGVDISKKTKSGFTPLVLATRSYLTSYRYNENGAKRIFEKLLGKTSETSFRCNSELIDLSPLHIAGSLGLKALKFIHHKIPQIPLNCTNKHGIHPVYLARLDSGIGFSFSPEDDQYLKNLISTAPFKSPKSDVEKHLIFNKLFYNWRRDDLRNELNYEGLFRCPGINEFLPHKTVIKYNIKVNGCATRCQQLTFEADRDFSTSFPDLHIRKNFPNNFTGSIDTAAHMVELRFHLVKIFYFNSRNSTSISVLKKLWKKTIEARSCAHNCACFEAMLLLQENFTGKRNILFGWPFRFLLKKALKIDKEYEYLEILGND